jgi:2-iminobutanoate/2-iminopropanoate deaminase
MQRRDLNSPDAPPPIAAYTQAVEVTGATRTLYISGQIGQRMDGTISADIGEQGRSPGKIWKRNSKPPA